MGLSLEWQIYKWINDELVIGNMDEKIYGHENWEGSLFSGTLLRKAFRRRQHWKSTLNIHSKDWGWSFNTLANWCEELTLWKIHWCWERLRAGGEQGGRGWDGWMASSPNGHEFEQALRDSEGQGTLACCSPWVCKDWDTSEQLNNKISQFSHND